MAGRYRSRVPVTDTKPCRSLKSHSTLMSSGKAAGPDGIPAEVFTVAWSSIGSSHPCYGRSGGSKRYRKLLSAKFPLWTRFHPI